MKKLLTILLLVPTLAFAQPQFELVTALRCDNAKLLGEMFVELREETAKIAFTYNDPNIENWTGFLLLKVFSSTNVWLYEKDGTSISLSRTVFPEIYQATWKAAGRTHLLSCELITQP